jgi:membrane-bound lytic murein transglycosylase D
VAVLNRISSTFRTLMARTRVLPLLLVLPLWCCAQEPIPADDAVLERIEALSTVRWVKNDPFVTDPAVLNVHGFAPTDTPSYSPDVVRQRLAVLDERTPFKLTYNEPVQAYINLYAVRRREQTARMLGLAQLYFPIFEEALERHGLPHELKYLAVVESALYPGARSRAAAVGLWQFMVGTGKMYGLKVDSYVDERCDVYQSTEAACLYLKDLYRIFGNWELALAAYNCGPGNVNKAMRRSGGGMDYWAVYNNLLRETRGYVPAFIAVNYIFEHAADYNIYPVIPNYCAYEVDTVQIDYAVQLEALAGVLGGNPQELLDLNPMYKRGFVPDTDEPATLYLPRTLIGDFIDREPTIKQSYVPDLSTPAPAVAQVEHRDAEGAQVKRVHVVRRGESLGSIAKKNRVSVGDLRDWNNLRSDRLKAGQRLTILKDTPVRTEEARSTPPAERTAEEAPSTPVEYIYHTVQPGDTLWAIAQHYPGVTVDTIKRLNRGMNLRKLPVGKKLKVGVQKG